MNNYNNNIVPMNDNNIIQNNIIQNNIYDDINMIPIDNNLIDPFIFYGPNFNFSIYELRTQLRNSQNWINLKNYVLTMIDLNLYQTRDLNQEYINNYVNDLNNRVNNVLNMIIINHDQDILNMIMTIVNNCNRNQKKDIYNFFSNLI